MPSRAASAYSSYDSITKARYVPKSADCRLYSAFLVRAEFDVRQDRKGAVSQGSTAEDAMV